MSDKELLLALSDLLDKKLTSALEPIGADIAQLKSDVAELKSDVVELKSDVVELKSNVVQLSSDVEQLKSDVVQLKSEQNRINIIIENEMRTNIKLLAENYLPSAKRYETESAKIESMQADIEIMKKVIAEHSEKLQKLA